MFGLNILNFILSLCFIFFLSSLIASWIYELLSIAFKIRAWNLKKILKKMIWGGKDKENKEKGKYDLLHELYDHVIIKENSKKWTSLDKIPDKKFGFIILDILKELPKKNSGNGNSKKSNDTKEKKIDIAAIKKIVNENVKNEDVRKKLLLFIDAAQRINGNIDEQLAALQNRLEDWFDNMMKWASEVYKRYASIFMFVIGVGLAGILNIDAIQLVHSLWNDSKLTETISTTAMTYINESLDKKTDKEKQDMDINKELDALKLLPIGWNTYTLPEENQAWSIFLKIIGILISALAISQGGPYWHDILVKMIGFKKEIKQKSSK